MKPSYRSLQKLVNRKGFGDHCFDNICDMVGEANLILERCARLALISKVEGKTYFAFESELKLRSRPINAGLFSPDVSESTAVFKRLLNGDRHSFSSAEITSAIYTVAIACCAAVDVTVKSDRKTQGTIFEWLCAALIQATLKVLPVRSLAVLNLDLKGNLPTDFIFDLGVERPKFHLPVKTSTRERIIQVWAHQRVLDGVYGVGRFLAMPIILTETKLDLKKLEVVEICLPWQWRLYQMHISSLWNVCYLDAPTVYLGLNHVFPPVNVITIGDMLVKGGRMDALLEAHGLR